ncbi:MAG TPA: hypothetical protein VL284_14085 [Thermoanaerobaculia bacterium]|nr:hypothetical protein [Thermoanaerobaculia bacterium]
MRRSLVLLAVLLASCATSKSSQPKAKIPEPGIGIEQVVGPADLGYPSGPIDVKYNLAVQNNAAVPITLTRVDLRSELGVAGSGAYTLRRDFYNFHQQIPPNSVGVVTFWAHAYAYGRNNRDTEPVTVRGVAYFDTPVGATQKVFIRDLEQQQ